MVVLSWVEMWLLKILETVETVEVVKVVKVVKIVEMKYLKIGMSTSKIQKEAIKRNEYM
jgi:hypothetical protein